MARQLRVFLSHSFLRAAITHELGCQLMYTVLHCCFTWLSWEGRAVSVSVSRESILYPAIIAGGR